MHAQTSMTNVDIGQALASAKAILVTCWTIVALVAVLRHQVVIFQVVVLRVRTLMTNVEIGQTLASAKAILISCCQDVHILAIVAVLRPQVKYLR